MESDAISRCVCVCPCRRVCVHMCACAHVFAHTLVTQSCQILCDPMDCSPPSSSVHEILQARILEWVAIPFSMVDYIRTELHFRTSSWCLLGIKELLGIGKKIAPYLVAKSKVLSMEGKKNPNFSF